MYHYSYGDPTAAAAAQGGGGGGGGYYIDGNLNPYLPSSSSPPYSSSLHSYYYLHRSSSTHSLSLPNLIPDTNTTPTPLYASPHHHHHHPPPPASSPSSSSDFHDSPVRRVFSTGDLQGMNRFPASSVENCSQEGTVGGTRVGRYTAEERKERIERYRSKRNQRNFHKKITYACRKTLADSRPRIRGRFARNGETETEMEAEAETTSYGCYSCGSNSNYDSEWWRQMQATLGTTEEEEVCGYDEDLLASFVDVFSMNLLS